MDGGAWWAAVHGVAKSWTRLSDFTFTFHFHQLEKNHVGPPSLQDEALARSSVSRVVPRSVFKCEMIFGPRDGGAWWAAVYGVAQSWTLLKQLSSSMKTYKTF